MPLRRFSGAQAIANIRSNPFAEWPSRAVPDTNRIEPLCKPAFSPSFTLEPGEKIFTIGSCFARNVERALMKHGFDVVTSGLAWPDKSIDTQSNGVLNNYGVVSIENEFRWALDPDRAFDPEKHFMEVAAGRFVDPHIPVRAAALEKIMQYRTAITEVTRRVKECRVVVMTLGLSELWFDALTRTYLNRTPPRMLVAQQPERFELHLLDFAETLRSLEASVALLGAHARPDQRILLTVSPVPLAVTHTDQDVLVANSYSKAVLRTVAEHIATKHAHVDYFPSYESVVMSERQEAWTEDQVHVQMPLIQMNVQRMIEAYMPRGRSRGPDDVKARLADAEEEIEAHNLEAAAAILAPLREADELEPDFAVLYAELCLKLGRLDDARAAIAKLSQDVAGRRAKLIEARIEIHGGAGEKAIALLAVLAQEYPKWPAVMRAQVDAYEQMGRLDDALLALRRWSDRARISAEPYRRAAHIHRARGDAASAERAFKEALAMPKAGNEYVLDYIEFLIDEKRFAQAVREIEALRPETKASHRRLERIRAFLPTTAATARATE